MCNTDQSWQNGDSVSHLPAVLPITRNCRPIMHRFEFWCTDEGSMRHLDAQIFSSDWDSQWSFSASTKPDWQGLEHKTACIPVSDAGWFKCHFWQLYFKAEWSDFTSFLHCHFLSMPLFLLRLKTRHFYLAYTWEETLGSKVWWKYYRWGREKN